MTTATVATIPTEEEIRAAIAFRCSAFGSDSPDEHLSQAINEYADVFAIPEDEGAEPRDTGTGYDLWVDLRPSEADRMTAIREAAEARIFEAVREVVSAALAFGAEHPDAPRAERSVAA